MKQIARPQNAAAVELSAVHLLRQCTSGRKRRGGESGLSVVICSDYLFDEPAGDFLYFIFNFFLMVRSSQQQIKIKQIFATAQKHSIKLNLHNWKAAREAKNSFAWKTKQDKTTLLIELPVLVLGGGTGALSLVRQRWGKVSVCSSFLSRGNLWTEGEISQQRLRVGLLRRPSVIHVRRLETQRNFWLLNYWKFPPLPSPPLPSNLSSWAAWCFRDWCLIWRSKGGRGARLAAVAAAARDPDRGPGRGL